MPQIATWVVASVMCTFVFGGCTAPDLEVRAKSSVRFNPFSNINNCVVAKALQPQIRVCYQGSGVAPIHKNYVRDGILAWFAPLRQLNPGVTSNVVEDCSAPDLIVKIKQGDGTAEGRCGYVETFRQRPYVSFLHELGHAVAGLNDTYIINPTGKGGKAGRCQPGQPESIMCWGAMGRPELYPDDFAGIQSQFRKLGLDSQPGQTQQPTTFPGATVPTTVRPDQTIVNNPTLFVAMGRPANTAADTYSIYVSAPPTTRSVVACSGQQLDCMQFGPGFSETIGAGTINGRSIYETRYAYRAGQSEFITVVSKNEFSQTIARQVITFRPQR